MPTEDKRRGKLLPSPVVPPDTVCFMIQIPNAVQYRAAFLAQIDILGDWHTWDHPIDGTVCDDCETAAQLWRNALYYATWSDECGEAMNCANVADCIENDGQTRSAIQNIVNSASQPQSIVTPGQAMTVQQANTPLNPVPVDCNPDELWAQCEQLIDYMANATTDTLEYIETYSNAIEGAQFIEMAPFLGTAVDEAQIDQVLEFLDWIISNVKEYFDAANTAPARQEIACSLFCACRDDCEITVQRMWDMLNERLGGILTPTSIDTLEELIEACVAIVGNGSIALDMGLVVITGFAKFAGYMGVQGIDKTLNLVLRVAMNDANNDWQLLCTECPDNWCHTIDLETTNGASSGIVLTVEAPGIPEFTGAQWVNGVGLVNVDTENRDRTFASMIRPDVLATSVELEWAYEDTTGSGNVWADNDFGSPQPVSMPTLAFMREYGSPTALSNFIFGGERAGSNFTPFIIIKRLTIRGEGTNPFGTSNC